MYVGLELSCGPVILKLCGYTEACTLARFCGPSSQVRAPEDYRIRARIPRGCSGDSCLTFVGVDTNAGNGSYLDIYLEGKSEAWVGEFLMWVGWVGGVSR